MQALLNEGLTLHPRMVEITISLRDKIKEVAFADTVRKDNALCSKWRATGH
jgi:hypothetical protein